MRVYSGHKKQVCLHMYMVCVCVPVVARRGHRTFWIWIIGGGKPPDLHTGNLNLIFVRTGQSLSHGTTSSAPQLLLSTQPSY